MEGGVEGVGEEREGKGGETRRGMELSKKVPQVHVHMWYYPFV